MGKILSEMAPFRVYIVEGRFRAPLFCAANADSPNPAGRPPGQRRARRKGRRVMKKQYDEGKLVTFNGFVQILFGLFMCIPLTWWMMGAPLCQTICIVTGLVFIYRGIEKILLWYAGQ